MKCWYIPSWQSAYLLQFLWKMGPMILVWILYEMSQYLTSMIEGYLLDNLILVFGMKNCLFIIVQNMKKCSTFFLPSYEICADFDTNFLHYLINCNLRFSPLSLSLSLKSFAPFTSAQWFSFLLNLYILTHSLKWYKDDIEFFTYIPRMRDGMKQRFFDVPGVQIDVST